MKGMNPFLPQYEHIPDGEPRVFGDRLYLFGSHDKSHGTEFCSEDYVCWSAPVTDICSWRYEGVIYRKEQDPFNRDRRLCMYAPDVVQGCDGRFYLYYALEDLGRISVAVCDEPAGEYEFYGIVSSRGKGYNREMLTDPFPFDPGVLVEGEKVYLYYGFCPGDIDDNVRMLSNNRGSVVCELESDMITVKTEPRYLIPNFSQAVGTSFEGHPFFEASSIRKVGEKYYFIYSSILSHELCYAVSEYPDREFTYGGILISNGDIGYHNRPEELRTAFTGNNHGSIVRVNGQWYVFYHRHTQAIRCCRQACAEKIELLEDGSILQVEITSSGLIGGALKAQGFYNSAICCNMIAENGAMHIEGTRHLREQIPYVTEELGEGFIANIQNGTQIGYKYFNFDGTEKSLKLSLRGQAEGKWRVFTDGGCDERLTWHSGKLVGEVCIELSSQVWREMSVKLETVKGVHALFFVFVGSGIVEFQSFCIS